jgi:hypothetical protein
MAALILVGQLDTVEATRTTEEAQGALFVVWAGANNLLVALNAGQRAEIAGTTLDSLSCDLPLRRLDQPSKLLASINPQQTGCAWDWSFQNEPSRLANNVPIA